ncbi:hypothetical protein ACTJIL_04870 [Luteimonas sp. 22616]|uniref:hypothetical protein n=1 Tax=Luteimonas sp. 22616 TaxID=3453951 RepID=UPI003F87302E
MRREEPKFNPDAVADIDLERPLRRSHRAERSAGIDWRLVWSVVLALSIFKLIEVVFAVVFAGMALSTLSRSLGG